MANVPYDTPPRPVGYQQLTVSDSAVGLTVPNDARYATISVVAEGIRFRDDGTNPTSTVGFPAEAGGVIELDSAEKLSAFKAIRSGGSNSTLEILYYKV